MLTKKKTVLKPVALLCHISRQISSGFNVFHTVFVILYKVHKKDCVNFFQFGMEKYAIICYNISKTVCTDFVNLRIRS